MFFRELTTYRITQLMDLDVDALEAALRSKAASPCASQELTTYGFKAPYGKGEQAPLAYTADGFILICAQKEERLLPGGVVRDALKEKVEEIEEQQVRKVYKKERDQLRDEIVQALLPRAFIRRSTTFAAIDQGQGLIYVNTSSPRRAEDLLSTLREALGSLPVRPVSVKITPSACMTDWLKKEAPKDFHLLDSTALQDNHEDGGKVVITNDDLKGDEVQMHLSAGKLVTRLSLAWQDKLSFVIDNKLTIKRLRFANLLVDQATQDGGDDEAQQFQSSLVLMMRTFRAFFPALLEAFGGEDIPPAL